MSLGLLVLHSLSPSLSKPRPKEGVVGVSMPTKPLDITPFHLPDHIGGFKMAHTAFAGVESRYGLVFPKKSAPSPSSSN